ncbi:hypothetical protein [Blastopirellula retiformator]|nr:hypothetical protein [Blastopirellula retiformator]
MSKMRATMSLGPDQEVPPETKVSADGRWRRLTPVKPPLLPR